MSNLREQLAAQGWRLSPEGLEFVTNKGTCKDLNSVLTVCQNTDLKEIGVNCLSSQLSNKKIDNLVVQIQKLRNIGAPKANEDSQAAPRMLKLILTDGHTHCQAVEIESINFLSLHKTAPGTKILLKSAQIVSGYVVLSPASCKFVGGQVPSLYDKWVLNKNISNHKRGNAEGEGPPPWVNFGKKLVNVQDKDFKSLEIKAKTEQSDFEQQRQDLIAEVSSGAVKKVFGGGTKPIRDVKSASFNNNRTDRGRRGGRRDIRERGEVGEKAENLQKKSDKISLFDFLETKLPTGNENDVAVYDVDKLGTASSDVSRKSNSFDNKRNFSARQTYTKHNNNFGGPTNVRSFPESKPKDHSKTYDAYAKVHRDYKTNENSNLGTRSKEFGVKSSSDSFKVKSNEDCYGKIKAGDKDKIDDNYSNKRNKNNEEHGNVRGNKNLDSLAKNMDRLNINASFVSKSFKQHLNISSNEFGGPKANSGNTFVGSRNINNSGFAHNKVDNNDGFGGPKLVHSSAGSAISQDGFGGPKNGWKWSIGDNCLAKYWEDNKYYNATVVGLTNKTCVVQFNDYGNMEEVLLRDCLPITDAKSEASLSQQGQTRREFTGSYEYRRGGNKRY